MSEFPAKEAMARPEQISEAMKEVDGKGLDESERSPGFISETAPAPPITDAELEQYRSLFDFDIATMFDGDWTGLLPEGIDQFSAIDPNLDQNAFPVTIDEQHAISTSYASANEQSDEPNTVDMLSAGGPSHEDFGSSQGQHVDFLNSSNKTIQEETNSWFANAVAIQTNSDRLLEQNVEGRVPEFTQEDQAVLDSFGPAIADEISVNCPAQGGLIRADSQSLQAPTAQDAVLQDLEQLSGRSHTNSFEDPASRRIQFKDDATAQDRLDSLVERTEKKYPSNSLDFDRYDETFLSAQRLPSSPTNHDEHTESNHEARKSQSSSKFEDSAPAMIVQRPEFHQNQAGAAQNIFEHNSLGGRGEYNEYSRAMEMQMQSGDDLTHVTPPHRYPDPSHGDLDAAEVLLPYPCLQAFDNNNLRAGIEMQRAGNNSVGIENRVDNVKDVVSQRSGNGQRGKASKGSKKRADWETRPDAARPRVRMTEEEYQWLRPNEGPRDVFETQRRKVAEERLKEEADADALEKAGMPRPPPKQQKPFKGGIHIEVWEKDQLNNRRLEQGKSGRDLFSEKPKLRGKRKGRKMSESEPQPETKKQRLEQSDRFQPQSGNREMSGGIINGGYGSSMATEDEFNYGISSRPYYAANAMTSQMNQGMTSSGPIHNSYINNHYGDYYGNNYGNNNYGGNHYTEPSLGDGLIGSEMAQNGASGSMPPSVGQGTRPEFGEENQIRAVYSHNQYPGLFHSRPEQQATASHDRNGVPPPPYVESVQHSTDFLTHPPQRPTAPMYGIRTSGTKGVMNTANQSSANSGNGVPPHLAGQNAQLIDPILQSQAQFPVPIVVGAQTGEHTLDNYKCDEKFDDFGTQERREQ
ncbi:hypothetical protein EAF00_007263 [Botryotinia globosa]|nr:hypothetical protein EAF00_007263 [Botryotinia globosa]